MNGKTTHTCPDDELLSAWLDGEYTADEAFTAHVAECPACRKKLDAYAEMAAGLTHVLAVEPPEDLDCRILAHIHADGDNNATAARRTTDFRTRLPWIMRIAALVVLAAFFIYLVMDRRESRAGRNQTPVIATATANPGTTAQSTSVQPNYSTLGAPQNNLIRTVSTASGGDSGMTALDVNPVLMPGIFPILSSFELNPPEAPESIHRSIDLSDDITAGELYPQLRNALASLDVPNVSFAVRRQNDLVTAFVEIRSANRLSLVRHNNTLEFRIMQPDGNETAHASSVRYELDFVCRPVK